MTRDEVVEVLAEELRTNADLRRKLKMEEGDASDRIEGEAAIGFQDGDGDQHFITVESV